MRIITSLFVLLLTSCATTPTAQSTPTRDDALSRFAELFQFLPDDMQSYWFTDGRGLEGMELNRLEPDVLEAVAAGDFEAPTDVGIGSHRFVQVRLRASGVAPPGIAEWVGEYSEHQPAAPIGDRPVWRVSEHRHQPRWIAFVDDRFTLMASSPQLLERALQRAGDRAGVLRSMPSPAALVVDAREVLLLRPRPQPDEVPQARPGILCGGPSPRAPLLAQAWLGADGSHERLQLQAATPEQLAEFVRAWSAFTGLTASAMREQDGLYVVEFDMHGDAGLFLWLLFGLHVFI